MRRSLLSAGMLFMSTVAFAQQSSSSGSPDWELIKKESEARKAAADARAAEASASTAATKAQFGTMADVTTAGTTTAGDKAGGLESAMLSSEATLKLGTLIVRDICVRAAGLCAEPSKQAASAVSDESNPLATSTMCANLPVTTAGATKLYIVTETEKLTFDTADVVHASLCGAQRKLQRAIDASDRLAQGGQTTVLALPGALTAVNIAGNLLRSDFAIQGVALSADDLLLAKAVAMAGQSAVRVPMMIPSIYRPTALSADNPLLAVISTIDALRGRAIDLAASHKQSATALAKRGKAFAARAKVEGEVAAALDAAVKNYDDYLAKIATPSDKGVSELAEAARQMRVRADLDAGSHILSVKMNAAGGSTYTKKNFFATIVGVPFYISGGTVASFTLIDGRTGEVVGAGAYGASAGFEKIRDLHARRNR